MTFKVGDIVVMSNMPGHIYMIGKVHLVKLKGESQDMNRYDCQEDGPNGDFYYNMPGYLMRLATEQEIQTHRKIR